MLKASRKATRSRFFFAVWLMIFAHGARKHQHRRKLLSPMHLKINFYKKLQILPCWMFPGSAETFTTATVLMLRAFCLHQLQLWFCFSRFSSRIHFVYDHELSAAPRRWRSTAGTNISKRSRCWDFSIHDHAPHIQTPREQHDDRSAICCLKRNASVEAFSSSNSNCFLAQLQLCVHGKRFFSDTGLRDSKLRSVFLSHCCSQLARLVARLTPFD